MDIDTYEEITGLTVSSSKTNLVNAQIKKAQSILENLLGYSLDPIIAETNLYDELGIAKSECPCDTPTEDELDPAEPVVVAYRLFPYHQVDKYLAIDPCTAIHAVKLVRNGVTFKTIEDYRINYKNGIIKYLDQIKCWCEEDGCEQVQLAVDATWLGVEVDYNEDTLPYELQSLWCDMIKYYSDPKFNIKSETLGTHSYTKNASDAPETLETNINILKKYAGPNGTLKKTITL